MWWHPQITETNIGKFAEKDYQPREWADKHSPERKRCRGCTGWGLTDPQPCYCMCPSPYKYGVG